MKPSTNKPPFHRNAAQWSPVKGLMSACIYCTAVGLLMGAGYYLFTWIFQDGIRSPVKSKYFHTTYVTTPQFVLLFVSLFFGWISYWLAIRMSGLDGAVLMVPIICSAVVALGVGLGATFATIESVNSHFVHTFIMAAIAHLGLGLLKTLRVTR